LLRRIISLNHRDEKHID